MNTEEAKTQCPPLPAQRHPSLNTFASTLSTYSRSAAPHTLSHIPSDSFKFRETVNRMSVTPT